MIGGLAQVPFLPQQWLQPIPTAASYRAMRANRMDGLRLQFDVSIASPAPGVWDTSLFRSWIEPAYLAAMKINVNYVVGQQLPHMDAAFHEAAAYRLAREFGFMVESWSFGNEPGIPAKAYEGDDGPTAERDYMRDIYMPACVAFVRGIRRAIPNAWIGGCDADSDDVQSRYLLFANLAGVTDRFGPRTRVCDEESWHPYGEVGGGSYATLEAFKKVRSNRPWGVDEVDHQQLASAKQRERDVIAELLARAGTQPPPLAVALQGALARLRPTPDETMAIVEVLHKVRRDYPDCTRFVVNMPDHLFERVKVGGLEYCSFFTDNPIVSATGRAFAAEFAAINGPVDPIRTTMPVKRRAVRK